MNILKLLTLLIVIGLVSVYGFVQSGIFNVSATINDGPVLTWLLHTTMEKSVEKRATDIEVPDLSPQDMILAGFSDYASMCAGCHGEPGKSPGIIKQGLNPAPPDLDHLAEEGTAAEMFWVISNGIRMTGMPAFGKSHQPEEIWPVVAFLFFLLREDLLRQQNSFCGPVEKLTRSRLGFRFAHPAGLFRGHRLDLQPGEGDLLEGVRSHRGRKKIGQQHRVEQCCLRRFGPCQTHYFLEIVAGYLSAFLAKPLAEARDRRIAQPVASKVGKHHSSRS